MVANKSQLNQQANQLTANAGFVNTTPRHHEPVGPPFTPIASFTMSNRVVSELQNGSEDNDHDPQDEPNPAPLTGDDETYLMNAANAAAEGAGNSGEMSPSHAEYIREQDCFLPIANIYRIMKKSLPNNAKVSKEAKEAIQECVSEFISFVTSEASDRCIQEKRKTVSGEVLIWAMGNLGFDNYTDPLRAYLQRYREYTKGDKTVRELRSDARHSPDEEVE